MLTDEEKKEAKRKKVNEANFGKQQKAAAGVSMARVLVVLPETTLSPFMIHCDRTDDYEGIAMIMEFVNADVAYNKYDLFELMSINHPPPESLSADTAGKLAALKKGNLHLSSFTDPEIRSLVVATGAVPLYGDANEGNLEFPCTNIALGAILRNLLSDHDLRHANDSPRIAFVKQSSLITAMMKTTGETDVVGFLGENFDVLIDGHDTNLYKNEYSGNPGPLFSQYIGFLSTLSSTKYMKVYPPISTINLFSDKKLLFKIFKQLMLPTVFMTFPVPINVGFLDEEEETIVPWTNATWLQLFGIAKGKLLALAHQGRIQDGTVEKMLNHCDDQLILKPVNACSGMGIVLLRFVNDEIVASSLVAAENDADDDLETLTEYPSPNDWIQDNVSVSAEYMVQPYISHLRHNELRYFFQLNNSGQLEKLYMVPTFIDSEGRHGWYAPVDADTKAPAADDPNYSKENELVTNFGRLLTPFPKDLMDRMSKWRDVYPLCCQGLIYRVDVCKNDIWSDDPGCDETNRGAKSNKDLLFTLNEIGVVPSSEMFLEDKPESSNQIVRVANGIKTFLVSNWGKWPK